ncbi:MAG: RNA 2',3'-cyclic phosphodiesterase [Candidatus Helarchaeota archaeon]
MRCFLCIEIKKPEIINQIVKFQEALKFIDAKIKFVEVENLHLTLKFLGEVNLALVNEIFSVMKQIPFSSFNILLQNVGSFPKSRPRVIWIGISEGQSELISIMTFLDQNLKKLGIKSEKRKPKTHLTVGRIKYVKDSKTLFTILQRWNNFTFGDFTVNSIQLKKSILTPKGPIYSTLKEIKR